MDPSSASVYTDTWSPLTWVLILTTIILFVFALMVSFIVGVYRSIEQTAGLPRVATTTVPVVGQPTATVREVASPGEDHPVSPHAA